MGVLNVKYGDQWAGFSTIVDGFIKGFTSLEEHEAWRQEGAKGRISKISIMNTLSLREATTMVFLNNDADYTIQELIDVGVSEADAKNLVAEVINLHCKPTKYHIDGVDKFFCPNCNKEVKQDQEQCLNEDCERKFIQ